MSSLLQLHETLADLITHNLPVSRWLLHLETGLAGRQTAVLDVGRHLNCFVWASQQLKWYGQARWAKKWPQVVDQIFYSWVIL
ncbi:unnamed protein product [Protopolystoma xenopodis]|uniref:IQCH-like ATP-grasp domain-containing protein n=1 Tax=Protopolystoma xenopodis TaxID=117903 RepID=A0A448XBI6_9PLAT|nr:unnamed protein product [Protopolystoma xenopodis]